MRILFSCLALEGHFRPMLPLAHALTALGHEVAFATASSMEPQLRAEGFGTLPAGISQREFRSRLEPYLAEYVPPERLRIVGFPLRFSTIQAPPKLPDLLEIGRSWRPDAVVHESADLAAPLAAAALGLPSVNHSFGAMTPLAVLEAASTAVAPLWRATGVEPAPYAGSFRGPYVDICPPALAWEEPLSKRISMRPFTPEPPHPPPWLEDLGRPLIYVTLGTVFTEAGLYRPLLAGIAGLDGEAAALVTVGRTSDPASLGGLPPRVRVEQFVPQARVLPSCDVVISHGGSGTTLGALAHGLPQLLVPKGADQFDNAARCDRAGAAIVLQPDEVTPDGVRDGLRRLIGEPSFRTGAGRVAAEIAAMPSPTEAAHAIEAYLAAR